MAIELIPWFIASLSKMFHALYTSVSDFFMVYMPKVYSFLVLYVQRAIGWVVAEYVKIRASFRIQKVKRAALKKPH